MTRETLGGLVGRSASWVKGLEVGRLGVPKLPLLLALAYQLAGQPDAAIAPLTQASVTAPETIRYNGFAKGIIVEELEAKNVTRRQQAAQLAETLGLLSA